MNKFHFEDFQYENLPLPDDVEQAKQAGFFDDAQKLIDIWMSKPGTSRAMVQRLRLEKSILDVLPDSYPYDHEGALRRVHEVMPEVTEENFDKLVDLGRVDWIYVNGAKHYIGSVGGTLENELEEGRITKDGTWLGTENARKIEEEYADGTRDLSESVKGQPMNRCRLSVCDMQKNGSDSWRFTVRVTMKIADSAFRPGKVKVYLPFVCACDYVTDIELLGAKAGGKEARPVDQKEIRAILGGSGQSAAEAKKDLSDGPVYYLAPEDAKQRTILFVEDIKENHPFEVTFAYTATAVYHDLWSAEAVEKNRAAMEAASKGQDVQCPEKVPGTILPPPTEKDVSEHLPEAVFSPFMKALAAEITEGYSTPLEKARAVYDYITKNVLYAYVRSYIGIESPGEYCAKNLKGDCGLQALMFITLCRIAGIPARWQSGNNTRGDNAGAHDWAYFYIEPFGWLGCDPSYGGGAYGMGDEIKRRHYFGNLDPFRLPSNSAFERNFDPPMTYVRQDPTDNQSGEAEYAAEDGREGRSLGEEETITSRVIVTAEHRMA